MRILKIYSVALLSLGFFFFSQPILVQARALDKAQITFSFDDGQSSLYSLAFPAMNLYQFPGTAYLVASYVGDSAHITWDQAWNLYGTYGWEIGNHTFTHADLLGSNADVILNQIQTANSAFYVHGFVDVPAFNPPYGDFDDRVIAVLKQTGYIKSCRQAWTENSPFNFPDATFNPWALNVVSLRSDTTNYALAKSLVDQAVAQKAWLVFVCHDFISGTPTDPYQFNITVFKQILAYVNNFKGQGKLTVATVTQGQSKVTHYQSLP